MISTDFLQDKIYLLNLIIFYCTSTINYVQEQIGTVGDAVRFIKERV